MTTPTISVGAKQQIIKILNKIYQNIPEFSNLYFILLIYKKYITQDLIYTLPTNLLQDE